MFQNSGAGKSKKQENKNRSSCMANFISQFIFNLKLNYTFFLKPRGMFKTTGEKSEEDGLTGRRSKRRAAAV